MKPKILDYGQTGSYPNLLFADNPGPISPCDLGARCLTATTRKACASSPAGRSAIWLYNPRMASLRHGVEEPGDVQNIRLVVDTIPTLAWSARPDGSAEFHNQRWLDYTGPSAKQALDSGWEVSIHPDDLPRILETFREALKSARPYEVEGRRFRRFDGEFRWFLFRGSPLRDQSGKVAKWYGTNTDLEERKRAEDALRESEASAILQMLESSEALRRITVNCSLEAALASKSLADWPLGENRAKVESEPK